jgi:ribonuclease D
VHSTNRNPEFKIIYLQNQAEFDAEMVKIQQDAWVGFDTEFVGEKTYVPVLCLLQIVAGQQIFLVDTLKIKDLSTFLVILENPDVLKLTHAGDNDYKLLNQLFGTVPTNTFDTQIAAGFVGYNYPAGFAKLCEKELHVSLSKSHTVTDWAARPLPTKALDYAVEDVKFLPGLHRKLSGKLEKRGRESWSRQENAKWETPNFYAIDPNKEALSGELIYQLNTPDQVFLIRLNRWRRQRAEDLNQPRESILQSKYIGGIVKAIRNGREGFQNNRVLHEGVWRKNLEEWLAMYRPPMTEDEKTLLAALPGSVADDPEGEWTLDLLYLIVRRRCLDQQISPALVMPRGDFNRLRHAHAELDESYRHGWRADLLGPDVIRWFDRRERMEMSFADGKGTVSMI